MLEIIDACYPTQSESGMPIDYGNHQSGEVYCDLSHLGRLFVSTV